MKYKEISIGKKSDSTLVTFKTTIDSNTRSNSHVVIRAYGASSVSMAKISSIPDWDEDTYDMTLVLWFPPVYYNTDNLCIGDLVDNARSKGIRLFVCSLYDIAGYNTKYDNYVLSVLASATYHMSVGDFMDHSLALMSGLTKKQLTTCIVPVDLIVAMSLAVGDVVRLKWDMADDAIRMFSSTIKSIWGSLGEHTNNVSDYSQEFIMKKRDKVICNIPYDHVELVLNNADINNGDYIDCARSLWKFISDMKYDEGIHIDMVHPNPMGDVGKIIVAEKYDMNSTVRKINLSIEGESNSWITNIMAMVYDSNSRISIISSDCVKYIHSPRDIIAISEHGGNVEMYMYGKDDDKHNIYDVIGWEGFDQGDDLNDLIMSYYRRYNAGMEDQASKDAIMAWMGIAIEKGTASYNYDNLNNIELRDTTFTTMQILYIYFCVCNRGMYDDFTVSLTKYICIFANIEPLYRNMGANKCPIEATASLEKSLSKEQYLDIFGGVDDFMSNVGVMTQYLAYIKTKGKYGRGYDELA